MEIHRLKPMKEGYPQELFEKLYEETYPLRKSLAYQIDPRIYGVTRDIILSWFDDKFIFVFNKYFDNKEPDILKGFIINALKTYKYRILRKAYSKEGEFYGSIRDFGEDDKLLNTLSDKEEYNEENLKYLYVKDYMKNHLSDNAYLLFELMIDPPPYIISRLKNNNSRVPNYLYIEYLGIDYGDEDKEDKVIRKLKKEINNTIKNARDYFKDNPLALTN